MCEEFEGYVLAFVQAGQSGLLKRCEVKANISFTIRALDKAEPTFGIIVFHFT